MAPSGLSTTMTLIETRKPHRQLPHDNYGPWFNAVIWTLTGIAAVFLALRIYCKRSRGKKLWWDDHVLIAAFVFLVAQTSTLSVAVHYGLGVHSWDIKNWPAYLLPLNVAAVLSLIAAGLSKTAFAILLLHFAQGWMRRLVWFIIVSVNISIGLSAILTWAQCTPIQKVYDFSVPGHCWDHRVVQYYNTYSAVYSGAMDIVLALIPWCIINRRALNQKERLGVLVAMSMGAIAGATSIAKATTLTAITNPDTISTVPLMILATAESAITIMAASIPVLRVLITNTMRTYSVPRFYRSFHDRTSTYRDSKHASLASPYVAPVRSSAGELSRQPSNTSSAPTTDAKRQSDDSNSWLYSASESAVELPTRLSPAIHHPLRSHIVANGSQS